MGIIKEKLSLILSAVLYLVFNLRIGADYTSTIIETLWQIASTAPFVAGITYLIITLLHVAAEGGKIPWDRMLRLFFAVGIMAGLYLGISEYAGVGGLESRGLWLHSLW